MATEMARAQHAISTVPIQGQNEPMYQPSGHPCAFSVGTQKMGTAGGRGVISQEGRKKGDGERVAGKG